MIPYQTESPKKAAESIRGSDSFRSLGQGPDLYTTLEQKLTRIEIDGEEYFVAEGDTLLDEAQLMVYGMQRQKVNEARQASALADQYGLGVERLGPQTRGLIAMTQNGRVVRWKPGLVLTYRVVRNTFLQEEHYHRVIELMRQAASAWEAVCGVKFEHLSDLDSSDGVKPAGAIFAVRHIEAGGAFIASAFFPNDPLDRRRILIDPSFYSTDFDKVGVLRHEIGHVLGFRHEHIHTKAPPTCPNESDWDVKYLSEYDPQSVMHYFCGEVGSRELKITELDKVGAQQVYGPPLARMELID